MVSLGLALLLLFSFLSTSQDTAALVCATSTNRKASKKKLHLEHWSHSQRLPLRVLDNTKYPLKEEDFCLKEISGTRCCCQSVLSDTVYPDFQLYIVIIVLIKQQSWRRLTVSMTRLPSKKPPLVSNEEQLGVACRNAESRGLQYV